MLFSQLLNPFTMDRQQLEQPGAGIDPRYSDVISRTQLFDGLSPEVRAGLAEQMSEVSGKAGKVLTRFSSEWGGPTHNRLILPLGSLEVHARSHNDEDGRGSISLGTFRVDPGDTLLEGSWTDGAEKLRVPALVGRPAMNLRLERDGSYFVLDPLRILRAVVPGLDEAQVCRILANVGSIMSHRLTDLNAQMIERRTAQSKIPTVKATSKPLLDALTAPCSMPIDKALRDRELYLGRQGTVSVVIGGAYLIGTGPFEEDLAGGGEVWKESVSGNQLRDLRLADIGPEPTVIFPGVAMDGENRHVGLVGKSVNTTVREFVLPPNNVAAHVGLVRVITGQSANMASWVSTNRSEESLSFVQGLLSRIRGN